MSDTSQKRRGDRYPAPLLVCCSFQRAEGIATLVNISYSGALLEDTDIRPEIGTAVKLHVYLNPPRASVAAAPSELSGVVSRQSENGFAVEFDDTDDPDVQRMVDNASALVNMKR